MNLTYFISTLCFVAVVPQGSNDTSRLYRESGVEFLWNGVKHHKLAREVSEQKSIVNTADEILGMLNRGNEGCERSSSFSLGNTTTEDKTMYKREAQSGKPQHRECPQREGKRLPRSARHVDKSRMEVRRYYTHLGTLISDFASSMEAKILTIYTNQGANLRLLKSISRNNPLIWNIYSCPKTRNDPRSFQGNSQNRNESVPAATGRASPRPRHAGEKHSLIVTLCQGEGTEATLLEDGHAHFKTFDSDQNKDILSGFYGGVWETLKDRLNFTYTIRSPDDGEYGRLRNGSWTGLISDVLHKRADVIVAFLSQTYERAQVIDYSSVLLTFSYRIFARPSTNGLLSWTSYTQPFASELWASIVAVLLLLAAAFWSLTHYYQMSVVTTGDERGGDSKMKTLVEEDGKLKLESNLVQCKRDALFLPWAALTQQGWPYTPDITGLRIVFWTAYVFGVMILTSYSAKLVSFLTVTGNGLLFDSLEDLRALGNYRLGILKGSVLEDFFRKPTFGVYWNSLIAPYEDTLPLTYEELRGSALASPKYGYVGSYEVQRLDPIGACTFRSARQHLLFNDGSLAWGKGFPYGPVLNH